MLLRRPIRSGSAPPLAHAGTGGMRTSRRPARHGTDPHDVKPRRAAPAAVESGAEAAAVAAAAAARA